MAAVCGNVCPVASRQDLKSRYLRSLWEPSSELTCCVCADSPKYSPESASTIGLALTSRHCRLLVIYFYKRYGKKKKNPKTVYL